MPREIASKPNGNRKQKWNKLSESISMPKLYSSFCCYKHIVQWEFGVYYFCYSFLSSVSFASCLSLFLLSPILRFFRKQKICLVFLEQYDTCATIKCSALITYTWRDNANQPTKPALTNAKWRKLTHSNNNESTQKMMQESSVNSVLRADKKY